MKLKINIQAEKRQTSKVGLKEIETKLHNILAWVGCENIEINIEVEKAK